MNIDQLKFPIGKFKSKGILSPEEISSNIQEIEELPQLLINSLESLDDNQLDTPYRPDGWTMRQVCHHIADSHLNAYCRFKLTLTEDLPEIRPYDQDKWADLIESSSAPVSISLNIISSIHARWVLALKNMNYEDWSRMYIHPEEKNKYSLHHLLATYAWHGKHHLNHILNLKKTKGWD